MSPRRWTLRISDILQAIDRISRYTAGMTLESFVADEKTVDAVIRNLEVVGEASRHVPDDEVDHHPHLPWSEMRGLRNVLIHEYLGVSLPIIWQTVTQDLPRLVPLLQQILDDTA